MPASWAGVEERDWLVERGIVKDGKKKVNKGVETREAWLSLRTTSSNFFSYCDLKLRRVSHDPARDDLAPLPRADFAAMREWVFRGWRPY